MTEREPLRRLLDDQLRPDELLHEREQLPLVVACERLQQLEIEPSSGDGSGRCDRARRDRERGEPTPHGFDRGSRDAHALERTCAPPTAARGHEVAGEDQRLQGLLDEKRIPLRQPMQQVRELGAQSVVRTEDRLEHGRDIGAAESLDRKVGNHACALEVRDQPREPRLDFLGPIGECDGDRLRRVTAREVKDQLQGGVVAPMDVLECQEYGLRPRDERHALGERVEQPAPIRLGVDRRARDGVGKERSELGEDRDELVCRGAQDVGKECW